MLTPRRSHNSDSFGLSRIRAPATFLETVRNAMRPRTPTAPYRDTRWSEVNGDHGAPRLSSYPFETSFASQTRPASVHRLADLSPAESVRVERVVQNESVADGKEQRCQRIGRKVDGHLANCDRLLNPLSEHTLPFRDHGCHHRNAPPDTSASRPRHRQRNWTRAGSLPASASSRSPCGAAGPD